MHTVPDLSAVWRTGLLGGCVRLLGSSFGRGRKKDDLSK